MTTNQVINNFDLPKIKAIEGHCITFSLINTFSKTVERLLSMIKKYTRSELTEINK